MLYVSIHSLHRISEFTSKEGTHPKVNKLGTATWAKTKAKTKSKVKQIAYDLLKLYAKEKASEGFAYSPDSYLQHELEAGFMFEDTPDQHEATKAVKQDMERTMPMDRLKFVEMWGLVKLKSQLGLHLKRQQMVNKLPYLYLPFFLLQHARSFSRRLKEFATIDYINRFKTGKRLMKLSIRLKRVRLIF